MPAPDSLPQFEDHDAQQIAYTTCYMCACRCGIKVTLENDQVRFIQGNPRHPTNRGVLCAKGNAGIMKQNSPAKLSTPMLRSSGAERGEAAFDPITWDQALEILTERLQRIRETDPNGLAYFTGRDQMQALTGLFAQQFGTVNWAAHGGFCSVNMASAGLYTTGFSFWEFGDPDWDRTKYFVLWGVAEDHASNPIKLGIEKLKRRGAKFVAVNPVRTGYQAVADEWIPIKPGTDGMLAMSMAHVLVSRGLFDEAFLVRYTNAPYLVYDTPGESSDGLFYRDDHDQPQVWDKASGGMAGAFDVKASPDLVRNATTPEGQPLKTVFMLMTERCLEERYAPDHAASVCGIEAEVIERLALEMAHVAFEESISVDTPWTDWTGRRHSSFTGRPVSMHAMRGIAAHSNGFQTCRAIHLLQILLGAVDCPGGHRSKAPYPKHTPPGIKPARPSGPDTALTGVPLGFPTSPEDLLVGEQGEPLRIDKAYSWEAPLANHGLMHMTITNAVNGDPYPIDTLLLFMANMSWNSTMNTGRVREMLKEKGEDGAYKIPFLVVVDAFDSEMVSFADLVLPDTTYLERHDTISLLDRPISEPDLVCDSIRAPVLAPDRDVRPWQEVMVELATRLKLPAFIREDGSPRYEGYQDFIVNFEKLPGVGFLAGWRGPDGESDLRGEPNPRQWERYVENECFYAFELPEGMRFFKGVNREYMDFAHEKGFVGSPEPVIIAIYSEVLQSFRLAGQGLYPGPKPHRDEDKKRLVDYFDPLPVYHPLLGGEPENETEYRYHAITQRPMQMYHSWDSQNAWLRQTLAQNRLYMNRGEAERTGIDDHSWVWVESRNGRVRAQVKLMEGVHPETVWTWNAVGKQTGRWGLSEDANEATDGFLLNHLISELLPSPAGTRAFSNSDPVTGQAAWYDLKVKIYPAGEPGTWPRFEPAGETTEDAPDVLQYHTHQPVGLLRPFWDILTRGR